MAQEQHQITPPPELVQQWWEATQTEKPERWVGHLATQATRWGADQELEACVEWLFKHQYDRAVVLLRAARRSKTPSLKEQALEVLGNVDGQLGAVHYNILRRAIEALPHDPA